MNDGADLAARLQGWRARIEQQLADALALPDPGTARLGEAMRYSTLGGGKRLRPTLVYVTGTALGAVPEVLDDAAVAVELIQQHGERRRFHVVLIQCLHRGEAGGGAGLVAAHMPSLVSMERACAGGPSASARAMAAGPIAFSAASSSWMKLVRFMKSSTDRPEENRARRPVGRTWFGPAT